jgi:hypothetical protein
MKDGVRQARELAKAADAPALSKLQTVTKLQTLRGEAV